jgi:hypothetical protein
VNNREARAAAIPPLVAVRPILSVQWMIDIALEDKELEPQIVAALGAMRFEQARFYLEKVMMEGPPRVASPWRRPRSPRSAAPPSAR